MYVEVVDCEGGGEDVEMNGGEKAAVSRKRSREDISKVELQEKKEEVEKEDDEEKGKKKRKKHQRASSTINTSKIQAPPPSIPPSPSERSTVCYGGGDRGEGGGGGAISPVEKVPMSHTKSFKRMMFSKSPSRSITQKTMVPPMSSK